MEDGANVLYNMREYVRLLNVAPYILVVILMRLSLFWEIASRVLVFCFRRFGMEYRNEDLNYTAAVI